MWFVLLVTDLCPGGPASYCHALLGGAGSFQSLQMHRGARSVATVAAPVQATDSPVYKPRHTYDLGDARWEGCSTRVECPAVVAVHYHRTC